MMSREVIEAGFVVALSASPGQGGNPLIQLIPFALVIAIFYFVVMLPMRRRQKKVDEFLASLHSCGGFAAEQLRDSAKSRVGAFTSNVSGVMVGRDQTTWVLFRNPAAPTERNALVLDPKGDVVGTAMLQQNENPLAVGRDYYWSFEAGKARMTSTLVRFRVDPTAKAAPPPRSAPASASSKLSRPPE